MYLVNGQKAILRQYNRTEDSSPFDDQNYTEVEIKCIPYNVDYSIRFSEYTVPQANGYYQVPNWVDVKIGDQIKYLGKFGQDTDNDFQTVLEVRDGYLFNNIENYVIAVK